MKISLIKSSKDKQSFNLAKGLGFYVIELEENEEVDNKIKELIEKDYNSIILSSEVAGFSEDIIKKSKTDKNINIYIAPSKRNNSE